MDVEAESFLGRLDKAWKIKVQSFEVLRKR
jgi:hypothetical protein